MVVSKARFRWLMLSCFVQATFQNGAFSEYRQIICSLCSSGKCALINSCSAKGRRDQTAVAMLSKSGPE